MYLTGSHAVIADLVSPERRGEAIGIVRTATGSGMAVGPLASSPLLAGGDYLQAACLANYAAGLVVMKAGTATVSRSELIAAVREDRS